MNILMNIYKWTFITPIINYLKMNLKPLFIHSYSMYFTVKLPVSPSSSTRIHYCPLGFIELCETRHGFAKSTQEVASCG